MTNYKTFRECAEIKAETEQLHEKILKEDVSISSIYSYSRTVKIFDDLWAVRDIKTGKFGCIDIKGNLIIPFLYSEILGILSGTDDILVNNYNSESHYGLVDRNGNVLIEPKYNDFNFGFVEGLWNVKLNGKWGYVDRNDNVIIQFVYDKASYFDDNKAKVELNGESFYINKKGERLLI